MSVIILISHCAMQMYKKNCIFEMQNENQQGGYFSTNKIREFITNMSQLIYGLIHIIVF